jgi:hypothetical protein
MNLILNQHVQIDDERAARLEQLALSQGVTPESLLAKALDLLFLAEPAPTVLHAELRADWELLQQLEAEAFERSEDPAKVRVVGQPSRFDLTQGTVTHVVPVPPEKLRHIGEGR